MVKSICRPETHGQARLLEREGYRVATIEMDELQKAEAGLTWRQSDLRCLAIDA
jgi:N-dimethylarginine dimethylaminohydrolase